MVRVLSEEDAVRRPHLVEYDRRNPSPHFTPEQIKYINSLPNELSDRDRAKLDEIEYFILNRNHGHLLSVAIPGLRVHPAIEVRYVKRFNAEPYWKMINEFLKHVPTDFPRDQVGRCNLPAFRLTLPDGAQFYPIEFNGDLPAWRKRLDETAKVYRTTIGHWQDGKFSVSDGNVLEFADMDVKWLKSVEYPPDF